MWMSSKQPCLIPSIYLVFLIHVIPSDILTIELWKITPLLPARCFSTLVFHTDIVIYEMIRPHFAYRFLSLAFSQVGAGRYLKKHALVTAVNEMSTAQAMLWRCLVEPFGHLLERQCSRSHDEKLMMPMTCDSLESMISVRGWLTSLPRATEPSIDIMHQALYVVYKTVLAGKYSW